MASMAEINRAAQEASKRTGVPASVIAAQAGLESRFGKSAPGNNYFGIKAGKSWSGGVQRLMTTEYVNGKKVRVKEPFRKYATMEDSFTDWANLIARRYPAVLEATTPQEAFQALKTGGYATDPKYVSKLMAAYSKVTGTSYAADGQKLPPASVSPIGSRTLRYKAINKMNGEDVRALQQTLVNAGYDVGKAGADGIYGRDTAKAVAAYQLAYNKARQRAGLPSIKVDGIVGPNTREPLVRVMAIQRASAIPDNSLEARDERAAARLPQAAPITDVTRAPLAPISQGRQVPDTVARQVPDTVAQRVPDTPLRPIGPTYTPDRPVTNRDLIDTVGQNLRGNTYRVPQAPTQTPEQIATESLRRQLANMQAMPSVNPNNIGVDPRNLPVNAGTGGGVVAPDFNRTVGPANAPVMSAADLRTPQIAFGGATGRGPATVAPTGQPSSAAALSAIRQNYPVGNSAVGAGGPPNPEPMRFAPTPRPNPTAFGGGTSTHERGYGSASAADAPNSPLKQATLAAAARQRTAMQNLAGNEMAGAYRPSISDKIRSTDIASGNYSPAQRPTGTPMAPSGMTRAAQPLVAASRPQAVPAPVKSPSPAPSPQLTPAQAAIAARYAGLAADPVAAAAAVPPAPPVQPAVAPPMVLQGAVMGLPPRAMALGATPMGGVRALAQRQNLSNIRTGTTPVSGVNYAVGTTKGGQDVLTYKNSKGKTVTTLASGGSARGRLKKITRASRATGGVVV